MTMCFILPRFSKGAQGGYKMVYEYANRLTIKGHKVKIVYLNDNVMERFAVPTILKKMYANFITHNGPGWFDLNNKIENISNLESDFSSKIKDVDIAVATAIETVSFLKTQFPQSRPLAPRMVNSSPFCKVKSIPLSNECSTLCQ